MSARLRIFHSAQELPEAERPGAPPPGAQPSGRGAGDAVGGGPVACVVVADILRHTTTLVRAFAAFARSARAFPTLDAARAAHAAHAAGAGRPLLCGESAGLKPDDFDLGNSPREYTPGAVGGRDLLVATTNGAPALARAPRGVPVIVAAYTNLTAAAARVAQLVDAASAEGGAGAGSCEVWLVAAGQAGARSPEDDRFVAELAHLLAARGVASGTWPLPPAVGEGGLEAFLRSTPHGRGLLHIDPAFAADIAIAATVDGETVVPEGRDGVVRARSATSDARGLRREESPPAAPDPAG